MKLRDGKNFPVELNEQVLVREDSTDNKKSHIEKDRLLNKMEEAIKQLNPDQQQCVILFYLQKKSYAEVAQATGLSMLQVKSHLQNGKRNLKMMMGAN